MEMNHEQFNVTFDRLIRDDANARKKYDQDSIKSMKASILADGVIQPLAVRPPLASDADLGGQLYRVFAGGRRLRALEELINEKALPADFVIPVIARDVDDAKAEGMSLAENIIRQAMRPVDEFRAFQGLIEKGATVEEVALRFGQTERFVRTRMALAKVHPRILEAFEAEEISFASVAAYTAGPDPDTQLRCFEALPEYQRNNPMSITNVLRKESLAASSHLAEFITEERYRAAGGVVDEDLFGDRVFWTSTDIIAELKEKRLAEEREKALLDGWSFFETTEEFGTELWYVKRISPTTVDLSPEEMARMDKLFESMEQLDSDDLEGEALAEYNAMEAEYKALDTKTTHFTAEQKAMSGVVIDTERMEFREGVLRPDATLKGQSGSAGADAKVKKDPLALSQPLKDMIGTTATEALRQQVTAKPTLALALLAAMLEHAQASTRGAGCPSRLKVERIDYETKPSTKERRIDTAFAHYASMKPAALQSAVAELFAGTVDLTERWFYKDFTQEDMRDKTRSSFLTAFEADPVLHFDPKAYFDSCTKPMIDAAMKEMTGASGTESKKSNMAIEAAEHAAATEWLPKPLRLKGWKLKKA